MDPAFARRVPPGKPGEAGGSRAGPGRTTPFPDQRVASDPAAEPAPADAEASAGSPADDREPDELIREEGEREPASEARGTSFTWPPSNDELEALPLITFEPTVEPPARPAPAAEVKPAADEPIRWAPPHERKPAPDRAPEPPRHTHEPEPPRRTREPAPIARFERAPALSPMEERRHTERRRTSFRRSLRQHAITILTLIALSEVAYIAIRNSKRVPVAVVPALGVLTVDSRPSGAAVLVDGQARGVTPLSLSLTPGGHTVEVKGEREARTLPVTIVAGTQLSQLVDLARPAATGGLFVQSTPPGARVTVDGTRRGVTPATITDLDPGEHQVVVEGRGDPVRETVSVKAGATATMVVLPPPPVAATAGWIAVESPVEVSVMEGGRLIGTNQSERLMMPVGRHALEIVNERLGFRTRRTVQVSGGRVVTVRVDLPRETVNINAVPWAEVWIDGRLAGETPLGNVTLQIGTHQVVFRHPDYGERRQTIEVRSGGVNRVSVDLTR